MLERLQGEYDAVFSLGGHCLPSIQLDKNGLRPYAGPLDWMISGNLSQISRLLNERFARFMDVESLRVTGHDYGGHNFLVEDASYEVTAAHHFPVSQNTSEQLASYPTFKTTLDRRIARLLEKFALASRLLLVRVGGSREQAVELHDVLSQRITHDFRLLYVDYTGTEGVTELNWGLERLVSVALPPEDIWNGQDEMWRYMLDNVRLHV
ncbi:DUF1796 family putative cysteine peptidase [Paenibacillus polymyxa]|uniref:DUF1796 family putative cysteine peptidase n=1 Tax=Paenibacillus TaxID=44249 RepID=UPI0005ECEB31|nr:MULTISPECIES: DUF1796 family putative cysteine peptidase [Paenibacillus]AUS28279.1 hypothetical protein C1A50_4131 [Paenibacillus polymyxa]KAF6655728.1 hypothetical protein HFD99_14715 [Paenibacillus sp. EKM301P]KJK29491.1 hypothetical protein TY89_16700 [Paenibacillus polymyxa]MBE3647939.1 hypothetical protein [Paenibacillus polymyxa]MDG0055520.1 papain-like cysteine peptidase [Paenibacillus sp. P2(2022)]